MSIDHLADWADVLSAIGVIASLIFVGSEIRRNTNQSKLQNWASLIDRFITIYSETTNLEFAEVIAKGRRDYNSLTEGEKIAFGNYLYQIVVGVEAFVNFSQHEVHGKKEMEFQFEKVIQYHVGSPGGLAWYKEYQENIPLPPALSVRIERALEKLSS